ncbi:MAG: rod-binding protein [Parvularculaceae bacterium]
MDAAALSASAAPDPALSPAARDARLTRVAQEFEAMVLSELLKPMFESVKTPSLVGGGSEQEAFQSLLQEEYARSIAARGGLGVADQVKAALIRMQAATDTASTV